MSDITYLIKFGGENSLLKEDETPKNDLLP